MIFLSFFYSSESTPFSLVGVGALSEEVGFLSQETKDRMFFCDYFGLPLHEMSVEGQSSYFTRDKFSLEACARYIRI
jgi:hypothetical protein